MGCDYQDSRRVAALIGTKTFLNEFVAYAGNVEFFFCFFFFFFFFSPRQPAAKILLIKFHNLFHRCCSLEFRTYDPNNFTSLVRYKGGPEINSELRTPRNILPSNCGGSGVGANLKERISSL